MVMYSNCYISRVLLLPLLLMTTHLPLLFCFSSSSLRFKDQDNLDYGLPQSKRLLASTLCGLVNCVRGTCVDSTIPPFYQCNWEEGWRSPGASWIPCVLPNCTLDFGCNNSSNIAAPPATAPTLNNISVSACSFPVCGDGECVSSSNSSLLYDCNCNPGAINLFNTTSGYCVQPCAVGADCSNLNISLSPPSSPPPPPPASQGTPSPPPTTSQGTSPSPSLSNPSQGTKRAHVSNLSITSGILMLLIGLCL